MSVRDDKAGRIVSSRLLVATCVLLGGLLITVVSVALAWGGLAKPPNPRKAATALVAHLRAESKRAKAENFGSSGVVSHSGILWLVFGSTNSKGVTRVRVYRWSGNVWRLRATLHGGGLGPTNWISPAYLTGSGDPDFAIQGCGAGDTNCLSVISDAGGRWHAVPFEYGYGETKEVNGTVAGHLVSTAVDACGCAGGPSTWTYERYQRGVFRPTDPPGGGLGCSASDLAMIADRAQVQVLQFDRFACADGWALAIGTGAGFIGPVVGLFESALVLHTRGWSLITLDNGMALPSAPAIYDLPLGLLAHLAAGVGPTLRPQVAAARLIGRLVSKKHFYWPLQNGLVEAGGANWLIAVVPAGRAPNDYSPFPVAALIYRWSGSSWKVQARVPHLPGAMNLEWFGGWFVAVPAKAPRAVAFAVAGSDSASKAVITDAGGTWHIEHRRSP